MLARFWYRHFASELNPERERRLAGFAGGNGGTSPEDGPETDETAGPLHGLEGNVPGTIGDLRQKFTDHLSSGGGPEAGVERDLFLSNAVFQAVVRNELCDRDHCDWEKLNRALALILERTGVELNKNTFIDQIAALDSAVQDRGNLGNAEAFRQRLRNVGFPVHLLHKHPDVIVQQWPQIRGEILSNLVHAMDGDALINTIRILEEEQKGTREEIRIANNVVSALALPRTIAYANSPDGWTQELRAIVSVLESDDPQAAITQASQTYNVERSVIENAIRYIQNTQNFDSYLDQTRDYRRLIRKPNFNRIGTEEKCSIAANAIRNYTKAISKARIAGLERGRRPEETLTEEEEKRAQESYLEEEQHTADRLKIFLDTKIRQRAETLLQKLDLPNYTQWANDDPEGMADQFGMPPAAVLDGLSQMGDTLECIRRSWDEEAIAEMQGKQMVSVDDKRYLRDAEIRLQQLKETEHVMTAPEQRLRFDNSVSRVRSNFERQKKQAPLLAKRIREAMQQLEGDAQAMEAFTYLVEHERTKETSAMHDVQKPPSHTAETVPKLADLADLCEQVGSGRADFIDQNEYYLWATSKRAQQQLHLMGLLGNRNELIQAYKHAKRITELEKVDERPSVEKLRSRLSDAMQALQVGNERGALIDHPVAKSLGVRQHIEHLAWSLGQDLDFTEGKPIIKPDRSALPLSAVEAQIEQLEECGRIISGFAQSDPTVVEYLEEKDFLKKTGGDPKIVGYYSYDSHRILIRTTKGGKEIPQTKRDEALWDEQGHAIFNLFTQRTQLIPNITSHLDNLLEEVHIGGEHSGKSYNDILQTVGEELSIERHRPTLIQRGLDAGMDAVGAQGYAQETIDHMLRDELINQYASWVEDSATGIKRKEKSAAMMALFCALDGNESAMKVELSEDCIDQLKAIRNAGKSEVGVAATGTDIEEEEEDSFPITPDEGTLKSPSENVEDVHQLIREMDDEIENIRTFYESYPEYQAEVEPVYKRLRTAANDQIKTPLRVNDNVDEKQIVAKIRGLVDDPEIGVKIINEKLDKVREEKGNMSNATASKRTGLRAIRDQVVFLSLYDVVQLVKQGYEDITRIGQRRSAAKTAAAGSALTDKISDRIPYAGQLKFEYGKRKDEAEIEEVNKWKEALKDRDPYDLQELLRRTRNKDQVRAIFELLAERGRIDWNDEGTWDTLNALSNFTMPKAACTRDDLLRDKWIQKLITDIFDDKDHYWNWRKQNDGAIDSKKSEYTPKVDQLSNTDGGMDGMLFEMLRAYVTAKESGQSIPEEVDPHLYEEIIHYAIRMGKMTMEDKFFYLVQGIRYGLLSIDRLRTLAGSEGEILLTFPFIDYFYQRNNSYSEISNLAKRLQQSDSGDGRFKAGTSTTMWLYLELTREQSVKERVAKGLSRVGEKMDHDDMHHFLVNINHGRLDELMDTWSGNRQKMTTEGLKNGYVGFNMKMKAFANMVALEDADLDRFTKADIRDLAQTLASYMHFDNMLTENGKDKPTRPKLTSYEFTTRPVVGKGLTVGEYRDAMGNFVENVFEEIDDDIDWAKINRKVNAGDQKKMHTLDSKTYFAKDLSNVTSDEALRKKIHDATDMVAEGIEKALLKNPTLVRNLLKENMGTFLEQGSDPTANKFSPEKVIDVYNEKIKRER